MVRIFSAVTINHFNEVSTSSRLVLIVAALLIPYIMEYDLQSFKKEEAFLKDSFQSCDSSWAGGS